MAGVPPLDSPSWQPIEWALGMLITAWLAISAFVFGTRATTRDHERRIAALEKWSREDVQRLERKIDDYHAATTQIILDIGRGRRD